VQTSRGTFATWTCGPEDLPAPVDSASHDDDRRVLGRVLLVPGFTGSKEDFAPLLPLLAERGWRTATYDQRGQYETPAAPDDDFSLGGFAADLLTVAAHTLGVDERIHLVGHSFGGLVARAAALAAPERWASLTLLCSGPAGVIGPEREELLAAADSILTDGLEVTYAAQRARDRSRGLPDPPPEVEAFLHKRFLANSPESLASISRTLSETTDRTRELADLAMPVAVVRGVDDDGWPHSVQDDMAAVLGTRVVVIPDAAHLPAVENPVGTRDALTQAWLDR
jgi:pimeloyl-ACP methyl ester carboxylesterase